VVYDVKNVTKGNPGYNVKISKYFSKWGDFCSMGCPMPILTSGRGG